MIIVMIKRAKVKGLYKSTRRKRAFAVNWRPLITYGLVLLGLVIIWALGSAFIDMSASLNSVKQENSRLKDKVSALSSWESTCRTTGNWKSGATRKVDFNIKGHARSAFISLPPKYSTGEYPPVLFSYGGKGETASKAMAYHDIDDLPAIIVYPEPEIGVEGVPAWDGAPYAPADGTDIEFTRSILTTLKTELCINRNKIYAIGFSNGGGFAAYMTCKAPGELAAIAVVSGAMYAPENNCQPKIPVPVLNIHGDHDQTIPYFGVPYKGLPAIDSWMADRAENAGCEREPFTSEQGGFTTDTLWSKCRNGVRIENIRVRGGIHKWGNVPIQDIWRFLSQFSLPDET